MNDVRPRFRLPPTQVNPETFESLKRAMHDLSRALRGIDGPRLRLLPPPGPEGALSDDPRERALAARRNRNTGPQRPRFERRGK